MVRAAEEVDPAQARPALVRQAVHQRETMKDQRGAMSWAQHQKAGNGKFLPLKARMKAGAEEAAGRDVIVFFLQGFDNVFLPD